MTAESIRIERDALLTRIVASTASATRTLKTMIRDLRRSQWFLLVAVVGGAVIALVAIKLIALLAAAFDISLLRDVNGNCTTPACVVGGVGGFFGGLFNNLTHHDPNQFFYPGYPPPYVNPYGHGPLGNQLVGPDGNPLTNSAGTPIVTGPKGSIPANHLIGPDGQYAYPSPSAGVQIYFSQYAQAIAGAVIGQDGKPSSGNAGGKI
jgi:hypothetical protein